MSKAFLSKYTPSILLLSISMPITRVETREIKTKRITFLFWIQTDYHILISNNYVHLILELSCSILPTLVKETGLEFMGSSIIHTSFYVGSILVICPLRRHFFFSYHHWRQLDWILCLFSALVWLPVWNLVSPCYHPSYSLLLIQFCTSTFMSFSSAF